MAETLKRTVVTGACYDNITQDDVDEYMRNVARLSSESKSKSDSEWIAFRRAMCQNDVYYLLVIEGGYDFMFSLETDDEIIYRPWIFSRCLEVQGSPDFNIDIWARGHCKSTIITIGMTAQAILKNPDIAIAIFSYSSPSAQAFVSQVRSLLERPNIKELFPDVIPENPSSGKYKKSVGGKTQNVRFTWTNTEFTVKRKDTTRKEPTLSGWGLIGSMPTGKHFDILVYDDVVTPLSIVTESQNQKTYQRWQDSLNTGSGENTKIRIIGTFYSNRDTYYYMLHPGESPDGSVSNPDLKSKYNLRKYPCRDENGNPVLYTDEYLKDKEASMVGYVYATQMMCDPQHGDGMRFLEEWIPNRIPQDYMLENKDKYNFYILVDPAYTKSAAADYTAMMVVATTSQRKYVVSEVIRDKLSLSEKTDRLFSLVNKWHNARGYPTVFYEANSTASDYSVIHSEMTRRNLFFTFKSVSTKPKINIGAESVGKPLKHSRIMALEPLFRSGSVMLVDKSVRRNWQGSEEDMMQSFVNEYLNYPYFGHDDCMDVLSRIADLETGVQMSFPMPSTDEWQDVRKLYESKRRLARQGGVFDVTAGGYVPF